MAEVFETDARSESGAGSIESPLDRLRRPSSAPVMLAGVGAAFVHALVIAAALARGHAKPEVVRAERPAIETELIEDAPQPQPETRTEPEPQPEPQKTALPPAQKPRNRVQIVEKAAPAAAQAAKVLESKEVLDFGETFVQGNASKYAGGVTESGGRSATAVRAASARATGVLGGTGSFAIDRSAEPMLADGVRWECPFPEEADENGLNDGFVLLSVAISVTGSVDAVTVKTDPGHGFGREARRCALRKRWQAGRDRAGNPIAATRLLSVRFER